MTVDTNAPERIWADPESHWYTDNQDFKNDGYIEFIRLDLHEAAVSKAREEALEEAERACVDYGFSRADECREAIRSMRDERRIREALE